MQDFEGKVAVITGAASGIGYATAERLAAEHMRVVISDRDEAGLDAAVARLRDEGAEVVGVAADVASAASVEDLATRALEAFGAVHLLCNNAGVYGYHGRPIWEAAHEDWDRVLGPNLWGVVHGVRTFLPLFLEQGVGHLTVTASAVGFVHPRNMYTVSKHAVVAYTELLYQQLRERDAPVGVTMLCPGSVATGIFARQLAAEGEPVPAADGAGVETLRALADRTRDLGVPPATVAELLVEGIRKGRFYVFNDDTWNEPIRARFERVLNRHAPA